MNKIKQITQNYKNELEKLNNKLIHLGYECVFNTQIDRQLDSNEVLKGIVVMDNPGQEERKQKEYLVGTAGKAFNKVLNSIGLDRNEVLVFNKSSITTPATGDLNEIYKDNILKELFVKEQILTTSMILDIQKELQIPIMLHGYAAYLKNGRKFVDNEKGNRPLYIFFNVISKREDIKDYIYFYKHSSYGNLSKQISAYSKKLGVNNLNFKQYLDLGRENRKGFYN